MYSRVCTLFRRKNSLIELVGELFGERWMDREILMRFICQTSRRIFISSLSRVSSIFKGIGKFSWYFCGQKFPNTRKLLFFYIFFFTFLFITVINICNVKFCRKEIKYIVILHRVGIVVYRGICNLKIFDWEVSRVENILVFQGFSSSSHILGIMEYSAYFVTNI